MPLPDHKIIEWAKSGGVDPFCIDNINPASLDLTLGDAWRDLGRESELIHSNIFTIYPRTAYIDLWNLLADSRIGRLSKLPRKPTGVLAITRERINVRNDMAAMIKLKSTPIREGLGYPIADWVDPGYCGKLTLMFTAHRKIALETGRRIVQIVLEEMEECSVPYHVRGHYNNQEVPTGSWRIGE